jgi:branched-chain amino acid transport system ATP-binding protein
MTKVVLSVKDAQKSFGGLVVLDNVSFDIYEGEIVGLIGPNGAGKTTLFNAITGLCKLDSGQVLFDGNEITNCKPHSICRQGIARNFQLERLFSKMSIPENVMLGSAFGKKLERKSLKQAREEANKWLEFVGLPIEGEPSDLKSAQCKALEIARALAMNPKLMLVDEALAGLNPQEILGTMDLIRTCRAKLGITIFWIEHVMKAIMEVADRIIVLDHGVKISEGTPKDVASDKSVIDVYLGTHHAQTKQG